MSNFQTSIAKTAYSRIQNAKKILKNFRTVAREYGQWKSIKSRNAIDALNKPIPWYTYPASEYLDHLNLKNLSVFEYGSGNSTIWWSSKAKTVTSVEDNKEWHQTIQQLLEGKTVDYKLETNKNDYISSAHHADILIIDGSHRRECAEHFANMQTRQTEKSLMLIFDNSDWHPRTIDYLRNHLKWLQIDFHGFGPINNYTWTTSIFINPTRHHDLRYEKQLESKGGLIQVSSMDY